MVHRELFRELVETNTALGKGTEPADPAVHLLQENFRIVLGAWQVNQGKDEF